MAAHANGRFPASTSLTLRPGSSDDLYLGVTFGLLISHDGGDTFRWLCEEALGFGGVFDPKYRVAEDGTIYATNFKGLRVSHDQGCTFTFATIGDGGEKWVDAIDIAPNGDVWIGTADGGKVNDVYRSTDGGATFVSMGLASSQIWYKSLVVSRDQSAAYVSGYQVTSVDPNCTNPDPSQCPSLPPRVRLYQATNLQATAPAWTELPISGIPFANAPLFYFDAVHPADAQTVYGRSVGANGGGDVLMRSTDAGATWSELLAWHEPIRALSIARSGEIAIGTFSSGLYVADDGVHFEAVANSPSAACLDRAADGSLLACGANWEPDFFALGAKTPSDVAWRRLVRFSEITGPVHCPTGTVAHDTCEIERWPGLREQFGIGPSPDAPPDAPTTPPTSQAGKGCCQGSPAAPVAAEISAVLLVLLRRRRPSRRGVGSVAN